MRERIVRSTPLAAAGALLAALALVGLARGYEARSQENEAEREPSAPLVEAPVEVEPDEPSPQAARLAAGQPMDPNAATAEELRLLPRIGPVLAERIVADREARGAFNQVEDLLEVRGIGPRTLELLRPFLEVDAPADTEASPPPVDSPLPMN